MHELKYPPPPSGHELIARLDTGIKSKHIDQGPQDVTAVESTNGESMTWKLVTFATRKESSTLASDLRATLFQAYVGRRRPAEPVLYRNGPASGTSLFYVAPEAAALIPEYLSVLNAKDCEEPNVGNLVPLLLAPQA